MGKHMYTPEQIRFLKRKAKGRSNDDLTDLFNMQFGLQVSAGKIRGIRLYYGIRSGINHRNRKPIGSRRKTSSGHIEVKTAHPDKWKKLHVVVWEAANGKVPKGHVVIFADGNTRNFALDNLLLVSKKELAVMNGLGLISPNRELTKAGKAVADLKMLINKRKRTAGGKNRRKKSKGGAA